MPERKVATTVYITAVQDRNLKLLSETTGTPVAVYIRQGIDLLLEAHREHLPRQLGLGLADDEG